GGAPADRGGVGAALGGDVPDAPRRGVGRAFFDLAVGIAEGLPAFFLGFPVGVRQVLARRFLLQPAFGVALLAVDFRGFRRGQFLQRARHFPPVRGFV